MELVKATEARETFLNLASLYGYEAALHIDAIGPTINGDGRYLMPSALPFANGEREAYVVTDGGRAVGIVGFTEQEDGSHMMDEVFAVKAFRNEEFFFAALDPYLEGKTGTFQCHCLRFQEDVQALFEGHFLARGLEVEGAGLDAMAYLYTVRL